VAQLIVDQRTQMLFAKMPSDGHVTRRTIRADDAHQDAVGAAMSDPEEDPTTTNLR